VLWNVFVGGLAGVSAGLGLWQWVAALRFPLHRRLPPLADPPGITILKPLKGCDEFTEKCLHSWLAQDYGGKLQILFGVASASDPVCEVVRGLLDRFPAADAALVVCPENLGLNAKVSTLVQLQRQARHALIGVSDADVLGPPDLLANAVQSFTDAEVGLVSCFYRLAHAPTTAMRWEAVAVNADFWSQVLQSNRLKPMDFALGAVMIARREALERIGGFESLANCLADDYQLGNRIVRGGARAELCPVVVECWDPPQGWGAVWRHQLRWARTIRVCQPGPYFWSLLSNATFWPLLWVALSPSSASVIVAAALVLLRISLATRLQGKLTPDRSHLALAWLVPIKDCLGAAVWLAAFLGNTIEWRGQRLRLQRDGTLHLSGVGDSQSARHA
jgi:ceramide glucosyltransferase